jgi:NADH:ubiquinone oxidoreductase subunit C
LRDQSSDLKTLGEVFSTSIWLERELNEMHGLCFKGKKDLRNLMLQYGDSSAPFRKTYPSIGLTELFYDAVTDTLVQTPVSTQI